MNYGMVPPPASLSSRPPPGRRSRFDAKRAEDEEKEKQYLALTHDYTTSKSKGIGKRVFSENDYFENDSDEEENPRDGRSSRAGRVEEGDYEDNRHHASSSSYHHKTGRHKDDDDDDRYNRATSSKHRLSRDGDSRDVTSRRSSKPVEEEEDEEEDPLDAFMADINEQAKKDKSETEKKLEKAAVTGKVDDGGQQGRGDIDEEDMQESYFKFLEDYKARHADDDEDVYEYDEDGNIVWTWKKVIDPLPAVNHLNIPYRPFVRDVYHEHPDIVAMSPLQTFELRTALDIRVYGADAPKPVTSFGHFSFDEPLMRQIRKSQFEKPTPIQSQAIPAALKGRDVLGLAKTGSGKTAAYVWPAIIHIMEQEELQPGEGPIALVVVPTRELAIQVYQHAKTYCRPYNINVVCAYGGGSKYEQKLALEEGTELVICTPGRIIDMIKMGATNFFRITFLVFDEVDRMFDLGFEAQVKSIADHIRPDRQCLMFSATMKKKVEKMVVHALNDPVKIVCGDVGEANADVQQLVHVLANAQEKWNWLSGRIVEFCTKGKLLVFVTKKLDAEELAKKLRQLRNVDLVLLHGDMLQTERNEQITSFRGNVSVMIATDVAARGLDIPEIKTVVNFDVARDIDTHVHRIGRTGRAGQQGTAHTLVTEADKEFCGHLVKNLESVGQFVAPELMQLALKSSWFKQQQESGGGGGTGGAFGQRQRMGLGYKPRERTGFGQSGFGGTAAPNLTYLAEPAPQTSAKPTVAKMVEKAKELADSNTGVGLSRVQIMRSAMKSSFQSAFYKSSTDDNQTLRIAPTDPRPEWRIKLDERAASINQALGVSAEGVGTGGSASKTDPPEQQSVCFGQRKKRSRWE